MASLFYSVAEFRLLLKDLLNSSYLFVILQYIASNYWLGSFGKPDKNKLRASRQYVDYKPSTIITV